MASGEPVPGATEWYCCLRLKFFMHSDRPPTLISTLHSWQMIVTGFIFVNAGPPITRETQPHLRPNQKDDHNMNQSLCGTVRNANQLSAT